MLVISCFYSKIIYTINSRLFFIINKNKQKGYKNEKEKINIT